MTPSDLDAFAKACSDLVGHMAVNPSLADAIVEALAEGRLTPSSGPVGISNALKGYPGSHPLKGFLRAWQTDAPHLGADDIATTVKSALACYRLAEERAHTVDAVWTGPDVAGSEVRRTEAVVNEIISGAEKELLIVGYWLVAGTAQIRELIDRLRQKALSGVQVRFVFDPGEKGYGHNNFATLNQQWASTPEEAPRSVFSWSENLPKVTNKAGNHYDRLLHAKVIVADRRDALVTSANLTHAGLRVNLEMGLRVKGPMADAVVKHFDLLIHSRILERRG